MDSVRLAQHVHQPVHSWTSSNAEVLKRKIWVTRNGVNIYRDVDIQKKDQNNFVFNAAVNKGMETLLNDVWPRVKQQIPSANLTVIGGAYPLGYADVQNNKLKELMIR
jgi:hypothetical protein